MHLDPLCDRGKDLVKESRMIPSAEARLYRVSAKITASLGTNYVMGHMKSGDMVNVDPFDSNSALTTVARQAPSASAVRLGKRNDCSKARCCVRYVLISMLVFKKKQQTEHKTRDCGPYF